jgi:hypothetical protein
MLNALISSVPSALASYWFAVLAIAIVAALTFPSPGTRLARWRLLTGTTVILSGLAALIVVLHEARSPVNNLLTRDVVGFTLIALLAPAISATTAHLLDGSHKAVRFSVSILAGVVLLAFSSIVLLMVHCTSGDCL